MPLDPIEQRLVDWANAQPDVRALVLTSTRAVPESKLDRLSDYDVIVACDDILPYFNDRDWLSAFGHVLVLYHDPLLHHYPDTPPGESQDLKTGFVTQFEEDGLKIDFTLISPALMRRLASPPLEPEWDAGYRVLLDKDGITTGAPSPTGRAFIPSPPTEAAYLEEIELFFQEMTYVAKYLWRGDLIPARGMHEDSILGGHVCTLLEWQVEIVHNWDLRLKIHGRQLQKLVPPETWADLAALYGPADTSLMWAAFYRTIDFYACLGRQVGEALGYVYPEDLHRRCVAYYRWVQHLPEEHIAPAPDPDPIEQKLVEWGRVCPDVHALILTSTRAVPGAAVDRLSDYDVIVAVEDVLAYYNSRDWLSTFGQVLVLYRDPLQHHYPDTPRDQTWDLRCAFITQFEEPGLKIDFGIFSTALVRWMAELPLDEDFDAGYRILLDKDGITARLMPPTHRAFIPPPPSEAEFLEEVELFFHELTYVTKFIWRGDLIPARGLFAEWVIGKHLRCQIEWQVEIDRCWSLRLKAHGRQLQKVARPETWAALIKLYGLPDPDAMWQALERTVDLYARLGRENAASLGYAYPEEMHRKCIEYFEWVRNLPPEK